MMSQIKVLKAISIQFKNTSLKWSHNFLIKYYRINLHVLILINSTRIINSFNIFLNTIFILLLKITMLKIIWYFIKQDLHQLTIALFNLYRTEFSFACTL